MIYLNLRVEYTRNLERRQEHNIFNSWDIPKKPIHIQTEQYDGDSLFLSDSEDET